MGVAHLLDRPSDEARIVVIPFVHDLLLVRRDQVDERPIQPGS
jgi:hypothetical protein